MTYLLIDCPSLQKYIDFKQDKTVKLHPFVIELNI